MDLHRAIRHLPMATVLPGGPAAVGVLFDAAGDGTVLQVGQKVVPILDIGGEGEKSICIVPGDEIDDGWKWVSLRKEFCLYRGM